jgi:putative ABC transport system permease protein
MSPSWIERAALTLVPADWRDAVARDLGEEAGAGPWRLAARAAAVGVRLRLSRGAEALTSPHLWRLTFMRDFTRDLRVAVRGALRHPGYALAVIATLAIGIGANTAIFSVFNWIMFRPLPAVAAPDRLVTVRYQTPKSSGRFFLSYGDYTDLRDGVKSFTALAGSLPLTVTIAPRAQDEGTRVEAEMVTTNYFAMLGAAPAPGRDFLPSEETAGQTPPPAIVSRPLWQRLFDRDERVLGRTVFLDGRPFVIVGIAPRGFQGRSLVTATDVWVPTGAHLSLMPHYGANALSSRTNTLFGDAIGRLRPGVTLAQAQQEATAVAETSPLFATRGKAGAKSSIRPVLYEGVGHDVFAKERLRTIFGLLMGAVALVLLLACANAANLLLARTVGRRREIAVCQAIGASRFRIIRQQLAEGLVLSCAAGAAGLALAIGLTWLFDGMRVIAFLPVLKGVGVDWRVCAFAFAASLLTGAVFATAPAIAGSRVNLQASLKDGITSSRSGRRVLRSSLAVLQVTLSIVLLVAAGLFVRTLQNIRALDLGMDVHGVFSFVIDPSRFGYDKARAQRYLGDLVERLRQAPGVDQAAFTWTTPFGMSRMEMGFARREAPKTFVEAAASAVSPGYFASMRIPILAGRDFTAAEFGRLNDKSGVIVLSQTLAKQLFPSGSPIGARLLMDYPEKMEVDVVGVVGDVRGRPITAEPEAYAYEPAGQRWPSTWGSIVVRSSLPAAQTSAAVRSVVRSMDAAITPPLVEGYDAAIDRVLSEQRLFSRLSTAFAAVAALLAAIGIYGMMAYSVGERMREFGIRMALGARAASLLTLVVGSAVTVTAVGMAAGAGAAMLLSRVLESRLYGVSGHDPVTLSAACAILLALSMLAALVPALRATRADPVRSLRVD